jgi:hypothetical protein
VPLPLAQPWGLPGAAGGHAPLGSMVVPVKWGSYRGVGPG